MSEENSTDQPERMGLRPLARELGIAHQTLAGYEKSGFVARGSDRLFDVDEVLDYVASIDPSRRMAGDFTRVAHGKEAWVSDEQKEEIHDEGPRSLVVSKKNYEHWRAVRAETVAMKELGALIPKEDVIATLTTIASTLQVRIMNLSPKLRPHMADSGREILERELPAALRGVVSDLGKIIGEDYELEVPDEAEVVPELLTDG